MSEGRQSKFKSSKTRSRARRAIALLGLIAACLIALLIVLPARKDTPRPAEEGEAAPGQFSQPARIEPGARQRPRPEASGTAEEGRGEGPLPGTSVAIVIDDVGYSLEQLQAFLSFPGPITFSVLPNLQHSSESARRIVAAGKQTILHLPMEAVNGNDPGPGAIRSGQSDQEIRRLMDASFSQVPLAAGMNNHMGSKATADEGVMEVVMDYLHSNRRFFLDSRTTTASVGAATARDYAVPYLERDVFLDNDPQAEAIKQVLEDGIEIARKKGFAILIGHVYHPQIIEVIGQLLPQLERSGVQLVSLSALLEERTP